MKKRMADLELGDICVQKDGDLFVALGGGEFRWLDRLNSQGVARNQDSVYWVVGKLPQDSLDATEWKEEYRLLPKKLGRTNQTKVTTRWTQEMCETQSPQKRPMDFDVEIGGIAFNLSRDSLERLRGQISDALALHSKIQKFFTIRERD